ncbi:hypothetical protein [Rhabdothermincola salaria]|uniref:hypothetical protein n=1 Tax=Rhabdothermincola salaria TaxID=2903142 RepID=UPI001E32F9F5|nr:hypothetical protein [Rhabdothermincola salaria]MCD9623784.1 hypothetical protein [Rhabdothermincola salaria]
MTGPPRVHVAVDDGERIRPGRIGQPANTTSSLAFVVAALAMVRRARRRDRAWPWTAVAGATALVGVGSVGFHGPGNRPGKAVHDLGVAAVALTLPLALAVDPPDRFPRAAAGLGAAAVLLHTQSRTGRHLAGTDAPVPGHSVFHVVAAAALAFVVPGHDSGERASIRSCR